MSVRRGRTPSRTLRAQSTVITNTPQLELQGSSRKLRSHNHIKEIFVEKSKSAGFVRKRSTKKITPTRKNGLPEEWEEQIIENNDGDKSDSLQQTIEEEKLAETPLEGSQQESKQAGCSSSESLPLEEPTEDTAFQMFEHKELTQNPQDTMKEIADTTINKTPERRLTFELDNSINNVEVLKRDSEQFSILEKNLISLKTGAIKKKKSNKIGNLHKKVSVLLDRGDSPIAPLDGSKNKNDSVIVISSGSSAENTPVKAAAKKQNKNKIDLLRHTLTKKYDAKFLEISKSNSSFRRNMPNFALLHKKEFDRMEDIASMSKRKEERAKILLSGSKPTAIKTRNKNESPLMKKGLFHPSNTPAQTSKYSTPPKRVHFTPESDESDVPHMALRKTPRPQLASKKERRKTKEGYTRYGFKKIVPSEKENKAAQVAAVANKNKAAAPMNKETKRELLKGVRSNRRFELLMAMRKGKA